MFDEKPRNLIFTSGSLPEKDEMEFFIGHKVHVDYSFSTGHKDNQYITVFPKEDEKWM